MVIAETKRQMHETLEMKEEEVAQLRSRLHLANTQNEELQDQKEKAEKSGERYLFLWKNKTKRKEKQTSFSACYGKPCSDNLFMCLLFAHFL